MYEIEIVKGENIYTKSMINNKYLFSIADINSTFNPSIKSSIFQKLGEFCSHQIQQNYEDLIVIALSVFAIDKRFARRNSYDAWTREFNVTIPVICFDKWILNKDKMEKLLSFLSGDIWKINFIETNIKIHYAVTHNRHIPHYTHVSLFSGGLDSFCGAIKALEDHEVPLLIGNEEYPKLEGRQQEIVSKLIECYPNIGFGLQTFTAKILAARRNDVNYNFVENTSRTRSFLFLAAGLCFAGLLHSTMPVLIPENGFIGLNLPLTPSRMGSCSTRTTHPWFLRELNKILDSVEIYNPIINPYKFLSKTAVVKTAENTKAFYDCYNRTISCSHPANPRWSGNEYPKNCGYCYPCLIRKSSLAHLNLQAEDYVYDINDATDLRKIIGTEKQNDLLAMLSAMTDFHIYGKDKIRQQIANSGLFLNDEIDKFVDLYSDTMSDFMGIITNQELKDFAGL